MVRGIVLVGAALLLTACSDSGDGGGDGGGTSTGDGGGGSTTALEDMKSERLCELLPTQTIEQTLGVVVKEAKGKDSGRPPILTRTCRYQVDFELEDVDTLPPSVSTGVNQTRDKSVEEILDYAFTDLTDENEKVAPYDQVDGLGEGAAFGANPMIDGGLAESQLVVAFSAGGERFVVDVAVSPEATLDKLRPLAEELLAALQSELD
jgi:hypothetical protein